MALAATWFGEKKACAVGVVFAVVVCLLPPSLCLLFFLASRVLLLLPQFLPCVFVALLRSALLMDRLQLQLPSLWPLRAKEQRVISSGVVAKRCAAAVSALSTSVAAPARSRHRGA